MVLIFLIPFFIIAIMAWETAEKIGYDSNIWRFIFDTIGLISIVLGILLYKVIMM